MTNVRVRLNVWTNLLLWNLSGQLRGSLLIAQRRNFQCVNPQSCFFVCESCRQWSTDGPKLGIKQAETEETSRSFHSRLLVVISGEFCVWKPNWVVSFGNYDSRTLLDHIIKSNWHTAAYTIETTLGISGSSHNLTTQTKTHIAEKTYLLAHPNNLGYEESHSTNRSLWAINRLFHFDGEVFRDVVDFVALQKWIFQAKTTYRGTVCLATTTTNDQQDRWDSYPCLWERQTSCHSRLSAHWFPFPTLWLRQPIGIGLHS